MLCPECEQEKDASRFIWKPNGKLARKPCRDCLNVLQRAKYQDPEWRAAHRARCKDWESRNPDVRNDIGRRYRERNPEKVAAATRAWIEKNQERWRAYMREWNAANRLRANERRRELRLISPEYRERNNARLRGRYTALSDDAKQIERNRVAEWHRNNRWYSAKRMAARRALELLATPKWGQDGIDELYKLASRHGFHVDHMVPLNSPIVCGLHVIFNLQLLPPIDNFVKNNKFDPDEYIHSIPGESA